jgi:hypothetical protein
MDYVVKPLTNFIGSSDHSPLSRKEYQALSNVRRTMTLPQTATPASDKVDISSAAGRDSWLAQMKQKFGGASTTAGLIGSLNPAGFSFGTGLYAGVGQMSQSSMQSMINNYV